MKSKKFKIIFILSFIPYIYIICSMLFVIYMSNGVEPQGIEQLLKNVELSFANYIVGIPIIPACLTFQLCYIYRNKPKIMFMCSFIPYVFILLFSLYFAFSGISLFAGSSSSSYGIGAFMIGILLFGISYTIRLPIIPICLIFQIHYIINRKKNLKEKNIL